MFSLSLKTRAHIFTLSTLAVAAMTLSLPIAAHAVPITYTYSGTASGTLGENVFEDEEFILTYVADTDNVIPEYVQFFGAIPDTPFTFNELPSFQWGGISGSFLQPANGFYFIGVQKDGDDSLLQNGLGVFATEEDPEPQTVSPLFTFTSPEFANYDLMSPLSFLGIPTAVNTQYAFSTSAGDFQFSAVPGSVAFNAIGGIVVPEAGTFALALPALGMIGAVVLRRRKM
ncbi:MAG: hypothetical protein H8F28_14555 [Fibrella sp.]|nr:hypothetical protein [Armatimonadota bacterium]